jgi:hypothetical protein
MSDLLEQFGKPVISWTGQPLDNRMVHYHIYEKDGLYTGIALIEASFYSQTFDKLPSPYDVEKHFGRDERLRKHFR